MKEILKNEKVLVRGRKYTKLLNKQGSVIYMWSNENIDNILGSFDAQIKYFNNNLK
jgi:hypothetical protein